MNDHNKQSELIIIPQHQVGELQFKMTDTELQKQLGPPIRIIPMSYDRQLYVYSNQIDTVIYHPNLGLVGVSVSTAPVLIDGQEIFSMSKDSIESWLKTLDLAFETSNDQSEYINIEIPQWAIIISFQNGHVDSIEAAFGEWQYGQLTEKTN